VYGSGQWHDANGGRVARTVGVAYPAAVRAPRLKPWMLVSAIWLWPATFGVANRILQGHLQGWDPASPRELLFQFFDWIAYAIVTPAIFWISARWPLLRSNLRAHFPVHLAFALLFCVVWAVAGKVIDLALLFTFEREQLLRAIAESGTQLGPLVARNVTSWVLTTLPFGVVV
jgi:hypothetical protein